jgi:hypothetical protein
MRPFNTVCDTLKTVPLNSVRAAKHMNPAGPLPLPAVVLVADNKRASRYGHAG